MPINDLIALVAVTLTVAYLARLAHMVRTNRPATLPRSHDYELDPWSTRVTWSPGPV